jgi:hypothetical protein
LTGGACEERNLVDKQRADRVTQKRRNDPLQAWREQVQQLRRGLEADGNPARGLVQEEAADAYEDFLDSLFFYYGETTRAVERGSKEG